MGYLYKQPNDNRVGTMDLQTASEYSLDSLASKLSYLAGGGTKKQVASDMGATVGNVAGTGAGVLLGAKHLRNLADALVTNSGALAKNLLTFTPDVKGQTLLGKAVDTANVKNVAKLTSKIPKQISNPALKAIATIAGLPLAGYALGGTAGHLLATDDAAVVRPLPVRHID